MRCPNRPADLVDYAQGILSPGARATVAGHVNTCPICKKEVTELSAIFASLKTRSPEAPPESYWKTLGPRIHERMGQRSLPNRFLKRVPVLLPAAVVMLLVIFVARFDFLAPPYEAQDIRSILQQMADDLLQEVDQGVVTEAPAGTDHEILIAIFEDGETTEGYSELDQVQPESAISEDEESEVVARLQNHI